MYTPLLNKTAKIAMPLFFAAFLFGNPFSSFAQGTTLPVFKVTGNRIEGLNATREDKMEQALRIFEKIMNDPAFQKELLSSKFKFDVIGDPNARFTTKQVVDKIYAGREWYKDTANNTADINWEVKPKKRPYFTEPEIGIEPQQDSTIYTYTWFFDKSDNLPDLVGQVAHEWLLKLGFEHAFKRHRLIERTVPFIFGNLVTKYATHYLPNTQFIAKKEK